DILTVWSIIEETHHKGRSGLPVKDRINTKEHFEELKQLPGQSIVTFLEEFKETIKALEAVGVTKLPDEDLAYSFLKKLDDRRSERKLEELENIVLSTWRHLPRTLEDAYKVAAQWKPQENSRRKTNLIMRSKAMSRNNS